MLMDEKSEKLDHCKNYLRNLINLDTCSDNIKKYILDLVTAYVYYDFYESIDPFNYRGWRNDVQNDIDKLIDKINSLN